MSFPRKSRGRILNDILKTGISKEPLSSLWRQVWALFAMMDIIVKEAVLLYPVMRQKADSGSDFFSSLKEIMKGTMDFMLTDKRLHHLLNIVLEENDEFRNRLYGFFPYDYTRHFSEFICQAVESGQIDSRYPPEFVAKVLEIMFSNIHKLISKGDPEDLIKTANQVVDMIQYGISGK